MATLATLATSIGQDILNLADAENAFLNSARYSQRDQPNEAGRAFLAAGWAAYCQGNMATARLHTEKAVARLPALAEAHFQLGKIQMQLGDSAEALVALRRAIELDRDYSIKVASDGDCKRHEAKVQKLLTVLRHEAQAKASTELAAVQRDLRDAEGLSVQEFSLPDFAELTRAKLALEDATSSVRVNTYFGYLNASNYCLRAKEALQLAKSRFFVGGRTEIERKIAVLGAQIFSAHDQIAEVSKGKFVEKWSSLFVFGLVVSVVVGVVQCGRAPEGFQASFNALMSITLLCTILSGFITFSGYHIHKGNALAALNNSLAAMNTERERLELIRSELQRREKLYV